LKSWVTQNFITIKTSWIYNNIIKIPITLLKLLGILLQQSWAKGAGRIKIVKLEKLIPVFSITIF
jgi:hypothetical protein